MPIVPEYSKVAAQVHEAKRIADMFGNMHRRCYDETYECYGRYGGRGVSVCDRWFNLDLFEQDIKRMLAELGSTQLPKNFSLERVNNDLGYSPENCTLVDRRIQARNRQGCIKVEFEGKEVALMDLCEKFNKYPSSIRRLVKSGVPVEEALEHETNKTFQDYLNERQSYVDNKYSLTKDELNARRRAQYAERRNQLKKAS